LVLLPICPSTPSLFLPEVPKLYLRFFKAVCNSAISLYFLAASGVCVRRGCLDSCASATASRFLEFWIACSMFD
jgi:hypothetical protein